MPTSNAIDDVVRMQVEAGIAIVIIDRPPVNAIDREVRAALLRTFNALHGRDDITAIVVACAGRTFVAGADIKEFDSGIGEPGYYEVFEAIENTPCPVVAAVHGTALGAGVELALACHYRVAHESARFGLPELSLGIIPGAGGTQRLPRVIPLSAALDMMLSGKPLPASQAKAIGLVDAVVAGDVINSAVAFAQDIVQSHPGPRRTRDRPVQDATAAAAIFAEARARVAKTMRNRTSPYALIEAVEAAVALPFAHGINVEAAKTRELVPALEARALRHLFFAEREVRRIPDLPASTQPREVATVGIVGAGTMGGGIAMAFANAGIPVTLIDSKEEALARALATIRKNYDRSIGRGSLDSAEVERRIARIETATDYQRLGAADLVIEAVFENMALKQSVFAKLDEVVRPGAILGTNTSTLDIEAIANVTRRPRDVIGLHFFSPANVMPLLEIVRTPQVAPDVLATAMKTAERIRKIGVVARNAYGFIGNRMMDPYGREAERCLLEGATPADIDGGLEEFGMAMGILAVYDLAGTDIGHLTRIERKHLLPDDPTLYRASALLNERGWLGQKSGRGFYRYDGDKRTPDDEAIAMFRAEAKRLAVPQRRPAPREIVERCICSLINEGARLLDEGVALRASDIDVVYTSGYGFPRYRGGPMFYADTLGLANVHRRVLEFHDRLDARYWKPAPLLARLACEDSTFAAFDAQRAKSSAR